MHTEPKPSNPDVQYEKTDAHSRPLYQFLFWISAITLLTALLSLGILRALESWRDESSTRAIMAEPQEQQWPPAPRLQTREPADLAAFRKEEAEILTTYGVVDREKGIYRIPIEEAMKLTLERGLPATGEAEGSEPSAKDLAKALKK
ncbi:MAG: hypothetical protein JJE39_05585 [Vicinamibacteria bacterium]|nr:hypothetical protein [Vicinamibacteria bacterium]